jgi:hypothetical protein
MVSEDLIADFEHQLVDTRDNQRAFASMLLNSEPLQKVSLSSACFLSARVAPPPSRSSYPTRDLPDLGRSGRIGEIFRDRLRSHEKARDFADPSRSRVICEISRDQADLARSARGGSSAKSLTVEISKGLNCCCEKVDLKK